MAEQGPLRYSAPFFSSEEFTVQEDELNSEERPLSLPLNLGLNDGTICPQRCIDVMQAHSARTSLRHYTTPDNDPLREVIASHDSVGVDNIYLAHGSGPLLKQCVPFLIKKKITASPTRIVRHLVRRSGFPIITGRLTYFKVPLKGANAGLTVKLLPLGPETSFALRLEDVEATLKKGDGLVYICNPNNPTGQLMLEREQIEHLLQRYPKSLFWVDEAYVQYLAPARYQSVSELVREHSNLLVSRTFSFAYGMAGVRMGYLLTSAERVRAFEQQVTNYRFGTLQEQLATAALQDTEHLPQLREMTARDRAEVTERLRSYRGVEAYDSMTHFILARFTDGRTGPWLGEELKARGVRIKTFKPIGKETYDEFFRITLGMRQENAFLLHHLDELLG